MKRKFDSDSFKSHLNMQFERVEELNRKCKNTDSVITAFKAFTGICADRIQAISKFTTTPIKVSSFLDNYLRLYWFRHFLAVKDELSVLIKGELQREYHKIEHQNMKHERGHEQSYFLNKYELTSCSCDGMDYEYRILSNYRPDNAKLETLASSLDNINQELQSRSATVDNIFESIKPYILKISMINSVSMSYLHNNEYIKVYFKDETIKPLKISRADIAIESTRESAFSTAIEDPEDLIIGVATKTKNLNNKLLKHSNRALVIDSDDEDESSNLNKIKSSFLGADNDLSLRDIKLAHGVNEDEKDKYDSDGNEIEFENNLNSISSKKLASNTASSSSTKMQLESESVQAVIKESALNEAYRPNTLHSTKCKQQFVPKNSCKVITIKVVDPTCADTIFKDIKVSISWNSSFINPTLNADKSEVILSTSDTLDAIMTELWMGYVPMPWVPVDLISGDKALRRGTSLKWKSEDQLVVRCHKQLTILQFCEFVYSNGLCQELFEEHRNSMHLNPKPLLLSLLKTVQIISDSLSKHVQGQAFEIDMSRHPNVMFLLSEWEVLFNSILQKLAEIIKGSPIVVNLRFNAISSKSLSLFMKYSTVLDMSCSDLTSSKLLEASLLNTTAKNSTPQYFQIQTLIIQWNQALLIEEATFFNSFNGKLKDWFKLETISNHDLSSSSGNQNNLNKTVTVTEAITTSPWVQSITSLFLIESMQNFDVSYSAVSSEEYTLLAFGILHGLNKRKELKFKPMQRIIIRGFIKAFPDIYEEFATEMKLHFQDVNFDCIS